MRKLFIGVLVMTLIFGGIGIASAFGGPGGNMGYRQQNVQKPYYNQQNANPFDLSEEQEEKIEDVQENFWEIREDKRAELLEANQELRELYFNNGDKSEIEKSQEKVNSLQTELNQSRFNYWNEVKNILTDEQLEELEEGNFGMRLNNNFNNSGAYGPGMRRSRPGARGYGMQGNYNSKGYVGQRGSDYCH
ncbi:MAG: Spy/CpxP family protein refolding chaperone [Bacillota bacterium]